MYLTIKHWKNITIGDEDKENITMEQLILPIFPAIDAEVDKSTVGPRWDRWVVRLENLFVALQLVDPIVQEGHEPDVAVIKRIDDRKRALLLHYVGEQTFDIYEAQKEETETTYTATLKVLSDYFRPRKIRKRKYIRLVTENRRKDRHLISTLRNYGNLLKIVSLQILIRKFSLS